MMIYICYCSYWKKTKSTELTEKALRLAAAGGKKDFMQVIIIDPEIEILEIVVM